MVFMTAFADAAALPNLIDWRHCHRTCVTSTNALLVDAAKSGEAGGLWLSAGQQTQGRGRRGRTWASPDANLYASLLLINPAPATALGTLPLVAALAACKAVAAVLPAKFAAQTKIKWPNDVLIDGAKCAGLLLETATTNAGDIAVVIGFGINCAFHPDETAYRATSIDTHADQPVAPSVVFDKLASHFHQLLSLWDQARGIAAIRQTWLDHAAGLGQQITVNLPDRHEVGTFAAIDAEGFLLLEQANGKTMRIAAGDVFL